MSEFAGVIGWVLHLFGELLAPNGWTRRRAALLVALAVLVAAVLFVVAWPDGLPA